MPSSARTGLLDGGGGLARLPLAGAGDAGGAAELGNGGVGEGEAGGFAALLAGHDDLLPLGVDLHALAEAAGGIEVVEQGEEAARAVLRLVVGIKVTGDARSGTSPLPSASTTMTFMRPTSARALTIGLLLVSGVASAVRRTPSGHVNIQRGPFEGRQPYGDDRNKHTQVAEYTLAELQDFLRGKATKEKPVEDFVRGVKQRNIDYGGQLSSEGWAKYELLLGDALLNGTVMAKGKKVENEASFPVGIDVQTGKATGIYCVKFDDRVRAWHLYPGRCE